MNYPLAYTLVGFAHALWPCSGDTILSNGFGLDAPFRDVIVQPATRRNSVACSITTTEKETYAMRSFASAVISCAFVLAACNDATPTAPGGRRPHSAPRASVANGTNVGVSLPSSIYADPETNTCDLPLTYEATSSLSTPAYFDAGSVQAAGNSYSLSRPAFSAAMGATIVPGLTHTGVILDWTLNPPHGGAPYTGSVVVQVVEGDQRWFGILNYECVVAPHGSPGNSSGIPLP